MAAILRHNGPLVFGNNGLPEVSGRPTDNDQQSFPGDVEQAWAAVALLGFLLSV